MPVNLLFLILLIDKVLREYFEATLLATCTSWQHQSKHSWIDDHSGLVFGRVG